MNMLDRIVRLSESIGYFPIDAEVEERDRLVAELQRRLCPRCKGTRRIILCNGHTVAKDECTCGGGR